MYPVTAPANSCASQPDPSERTGKELSARREFKVISGAHSSGDFRKSLRKIDPGELASKILQLHAAADRTDPGDAEKPNLAAEPHDVPFEIPGVLRKADDAEKMADVVKRSAERNPDTLHSAGNRSAKLRVRPLVAAALLVGLAGGAALALGLPDMMASDEPETHPVATQLIVTAPPPVSAIQSPVTETAASARVPERAAKTGPFNTATPEQIAEAKNRLRLAFASGNTGASATPATTRAGAVAPVYPQAAPAQAATTVPLQDGSLPVSGLSAGLTTPPYAVAVPSATQSGQASTSTTASASVSTGISDSEAIAANNSPAAVVSASEAGTVPIETTSAKDVGAYANSGKTTASVNMRLSEKKNSEIIAVIPANTTISFNDCGKWWCGVEYDGKTGFVGQRFVERAAQ
ncbi:hypothetical protein [Roseibium sp.]|uniref:hypothetical protein n=1 Tax=Roseibium sp. TaxID=1936156 RepID=UPI003BAD4768